MPTNHFFPKTCHVKRPSFNRQANNTDKAHSRAMAISHVVGQVVLLLDVCLEAVRHVVEVVLADAADEAVGLHVLLHRLQLVTELTESVNDQT